MKYTKENLKKALKTRLNEYEMLNKTYIEMIERNSSEESLNQLKTALNESYENIKTLQDWIAEKKDVKNDVEYSFYDKVKKPAKTIDIGSGGRIDYKTLEKTVDDLNEQLKKGEKFGEITHKSLYDNIKKEEKTSKLGDYAPYNTPYNTLNYESIYEGKDTKNELIFLRTKTNEKYLDNIITNSNRFLVRFNGGLSIQEWMVKGVEFSPMDVKKLIVVIQDHLATNKEGKKYPIISELRSAANSTYFPLFTISIDFLDRGGNILYTERYHGCRIKDVMRGNGITYENDEFNTISFTVSFNEITYETSH